jgi:uncharacterized SAM-binding protein YcdF (DUF218 family)
VTTSRKRVLSATVALALVLAASPWWIDWPARLLVQSDAPVKSDGIVVLAGDGAGYRIQAGAELAKQGYAPIVLSSGAEWFYGACECDLAIDYAVRNGQPRELFAPLRNTATSTDAEAREIFAEVQRRQWKSVLVVTSDYHTRRTRIILNRLKPPGVSLTVFGAPDRYFRPDHWWWHRESRKTLVLEWSKLVAEMLGGL